MKIKHLFPLLASLFAVCIIGISFLRIRSQILIVDEGNHLDQIMRFVHGDTQFNQILMTVPGYHFVLALIIKSLGITALPDVRMVSFFINILILPVFYIILKTIKNPTPLFSTVRYGFFPILFPFLFLIYTDIFSLLLILLAFYFVLKNKYMESGVFISMSLFVRQNNVIWLLFFNLILYFLQYGYSFDKKSVTTHLRKSIPYVFGVLLLGLFFIKSGGVVVSGYAKSFMHVSWSLFGNVYFCLFVAGIVFLPHLLSQFSKMKRFIQANKLVIPLIILFFFFYHATFINDNPFNHSVWFMHNLALEFFTKDFLNKSIFFCVVCYSLLAIMVSDLRVKWGWFLYPFTIVYLLPYWLIEERYYLIPLTLFLLVSKPVSRKIEYIQFVWWIGLSLFFFEGIQSLRFFL